MPWPDGGAPFAWFGGCLATDLVEVSSDARALGRGGWWAVVLTFEGTLTAARFADVRRAPLPAGTWTPVPGAWTSSLSRTAYVGAVERVREEIAAGEVYQVNVCRVLSTPAPQGGDLQRRDVLGLANVLATGNPSPYAGAVWIPSHDVAVVSASPELFLRRTGDVIESRPIKGTGRVAADLSPKDRAENVMIVDLVRNDLGALCRTGSVSVPDLCIVEEHPGLVHLVSTVRGELQPRATWTDLLCAAFPPGSVSGAPKSSALRIISELEPVERGPYCGTIGWVDADRREAVLAVGIRSFWWEGSSLRFGTGAGITWGSDAHAEWDETQLKARHLVALVSAQSSPVAGTPTRGDRE